MHALVVIATVRLSIVHHLMRVLDGNDLVRLTSRVGNLGRVQHNLMAPEVDLDQGAVPILSARARRGSSGRKTGWSWHDDMLWTEVYRGWEVDPVPSSD